MSKRIFVFCASYTSNSMQICWIVIKNCIKWKYITIDLSLFSHWKKKRNTLINSLINDREGIKLIPINMDYCLLQFDALELFGVHLHGGGSLPNFNFFNINTQIWQQNCKVHLSTYLVQIFTKFLTLFWELLDIGIITNTKF